MEPLLANHFEIMQVGTDIFLDIGVITPEELMALPEPVEGQAGKVTFNVLYRVAMSPQTFVRLHEKVSSVFEAFKPALESMKGIVEIETPDVSPTYDKNK